MSDLSSIERLKFEVLFDMESGYVLDFSNNTFSVFTIENVGIDIFDSKYEYGSSSKANRLRKFWLEESNEVVGKLLSALLDYWLMKKQTSEAKLSSREKTLYDECQKIVNRLNQVPFRQTQEKTSSSLQKGRIFISYRRIDSAGYAGRIYDRLAAHFGESAVFMDVDTIEGGTDFIKVLEDAVQSCDVLIALIGKQWLTIKDNRGERRLDNPEDFVRIEIATALKRNIRVIPVLVDGIDMPQPTELPKNLKALARRNALQVNHHSFNPDVYRLIEHSELALVEAEELRVTKVQALQAARENAEREAAEKAAREKAEEDAKEKAARDAAEMAAREEEQKAAEKFADRRAELEAAEKATREKETIGFSQSKNAADDVGVSVELLQPNIPIVSEPVKTDDGSHISSVSISNIRQRLRIPQLIVFSSIIVAVLAFVWWGFSGGFTPGNDATSSPTTPASTSPVNSPMSPTRAKTSTPEPVVVIIQATATKTTTVINSGSLRTSSADGMTQIRIPGSNGVDTFWIDQNAVSTSMFEKFVNSTSYITDAEKSNIGFVWTNLGEQPATQFPGQTGVVLEWKLIGGVDWKNPPRDNGFDDQGEVLQVSWNDALAYCQWAGRELVTTKEWGLAYSSGLSITFNNDLGEWGNDKTTGLYRTVLGYENVRWGYNNLIFQERGFAENRSANRLTFRCKEN